MVAFKAYKLLSKDPTYTTSLATVGDKRRHSRSCTSTGVLPYWRSGRIGYCHRIRRTPRRWLPQVKKRLDTHRSCTSRSAPVLTLKAYKLLSEEPTYTTPLATAGEE